MHELPVSKEIHNVLAQEAKKHNARIKAVKLRVGRISGLEPNSLAFFLEVLTKGTDMEGLKVECEVVDPLLVCNKCHKKFTVDDIIFICPHCGSMDCRTLAGGDLEIVTISLED
jgi:hydrogenase nickel incorporation protein HypA/HybF